jgi:hypothetical protein
VKLHRPTPERFPAKGLGALQTLARFPGPETSPRRAMSRTDLENGFPFECSQDFRKPPDLDRSLFDRIGSPSRDSVGTGRSYV